MSEGDRVEPTRLERVGDLAAAAGSLSPRSPLVRRVLWTAIAVAVIGSIAVAVLGGLSQTDEFGEAPDLGLIALAVTALGLMEIWHAAMWQLLLRLLGWKPPLLRTWAIWWTSLLARYVPSGVLMPLVRVALAEREGVPKRASLASVIYEVALSLVGALIVGAAFLLQLEAVPGDAGLFVVLAIPIAALALLHPAIFYRVSGSVLRRLGREPLPIVIPFAGVLGSAFSYAGSFVLGGFGVLAMAAAFHPVSSSDVALVVGSFSVAYIASVIGFVLPAGLGAREIALVAALSLALPTAVALTVAVALRVTQILLELGLAAATTYLAARSVRRRRPKEPQHT